MSGDLLPFLVILGAMLGMFFMGRLTAPDRPLPAARVVDGWPTRDAAAPEEDE